MVKYSVQFLCMCLSLFWFSTAKADLLVSMATNSWQEILPIRINDGSSTNIETTNRTTSITQSLGLGYEGLFTKRYRYALTGSYHFGTSDLHKLDGAITPRQKIRALSADFKTVFRSTQTFSFGILLSILSSSYDKFGRTTSMGTYLTTEFEIFEDGRLIQSFGSVGDSKTLAYTLAYQYYF